MSRQTGCIYKSKNGERWLARWRENVIENGEVKRKLRFRDLAPVCDRYRAERDVQPLLDDNLRPVNAGKAKPESTLSVAEYGTEHWLPWTEDNCKPSTSHGYKRFWKTYLESRLKNVSLRDFRTVDAVNLLADLHRSTGCGKTMLKHAKAMLSGIFSLARNTGVLDVPNPVQGTKIPKKANPPTNMHAATMEEVVSILDAVAKQQVKDEEIPREMRLKVQAAIALQFFAGLRPREARGVDWPDYDGKRLWIRHSVWRTHITGRKPKIPLRQFQLSSPLRAFSQICRKRTATPQLARFCAARPESHSISIISERGY